MLSSNVTLRGRNCRAWIVPLPCACLWCLNRNTIFKPRWGGVAEAKLCIAVSQLVQVASSTASFLLIVFLPALFTAPPLFFFTGLFQQPYTSEEGGEKVFI